MLAGYICRRRSWTGGADLAAHHQNFFDCIRGTQELFNADVKAGFLSTSLVHLVNISARVGRILQFDPQREQIASDPAAAELLGRKYREATGPFQGSDKPICY